MTHFRVATVILISIIAVSFAHAQPASNTEKECVQSLKSAENKPPVERNSSREFIRKTLDNMNPEISELRIARIFDLVVDPDTTPDDLAFLLLQIFYRQINLHYPTDDLTQVRGIAYVRLLTILPEPIDFSKISPTIDSYLNIVRSLLHEAFISGRPNEDINQLDSYLKSATKLLPPLDSLHPTP